MNLIKLILFLFSLTSCTHIQYAENGMTFSRTSFGTVTQIGKLTVDRDKSGKAIVTIESLASDQVQALEKVAEGVAKGLAQGVKP